MRGLSLDQAICQSTDCSHLQGDCVGGKNHDAGANWSCVRTGYSSWIGLD